MPSPLPTIAPLIDAAKRSVTTIQSALAEGAWEPNETADPQELLDAVETMLATTPQVPDLGQLQDLCEMALAAMQSGAWNMATAAEVSSLQRLALLTRLTLDLLPSRAEEMIRQ